MTDAFDTFIAHDDRNDGGDALYELAIAIGQNRREQADKARVELGEIARRLSVRWGDETIERYGKDIGVAGRTLRDYRQVVRLLTFGAARQFVIDGVPWKVMLLASRYHADAPDAALTFLETAARDHMTIDEAERQLAVDHSAGQPPTPTLAEQLTAAYKRLLDAVDGVPEILDDAAMYFGADVRLISAKEARAKAQAIRDALADRVGAAVAVRVTEAG